MYQCSNCVNSRLDLILRQILQILGGGHLTHKDLSNAGSPYLKEHPDPRLSEAREVAEQQSLETRGWLEKIGWHCTNIQIRLMRQKLEYCYHFSRHARRQCDKTLSEGHDFAHPSRLKTLLRRGHLVLMDATDHTDELKWQLYSLFIRNECEVWCPAAHMLTEKEDSDIVSARLRKVNNFVSFEAKY